MERKLRYLEAQIIKEGVTIDELDDLPAAPLPKEMVDLEAALDKMESEIREINTNAEVFYHHRNYFALIILLSSCLVLFFYFSDRL